MYLVDHFKVHCLINEHYGQRVVDQSSFHCAATIPIVVTALLEGVPFVVFCSPCPCQQKRLWCAQRQPGPASCFSMDQHWHKYVFFDSLLALSSRLLLQLESLGIESGIRLSTKNQKSEQDHHTQTYSSRHLRWLGICKSAHPDPGTPTTRRNISQPLRPPPPPPLPLANTRSFTNI
jgi:hypothetical protein